MFDSFQFDLTHPWWLAMLVVVVPVLVWYFKRSLSDFPPRQILVSLLTRCVVVALLALAMSGLALLRPTSQQFIIVAVDQSLSVDHEDEADPVAKADAAKEQAAKKSPAMQDTLGWAHYRVGQYAEAVKVLEPVVAEAGTDQLYRYHLGMAYLGAGNRVAAKQQLTKAVKRVKDEYPGLAEARTTLEKLN